MVIQHVVNRHGTEYLYFFCPNNRGGGNCNTPHISTIRIEDAVEAHYATVRFSPDFIKDVRHHINEALADQEAAARLLKRQLTSQLHSLDAKESNLINLAADDTLPVLKIKQKLRDIQVERVHLTERLQTTNDDLSDGAKLIEACLNMLAEPQDLYHRCNDEQRRLLNQAIFAKLYVSRETITNHEFQEPFAGLHLVYSAHRAAATDKPDPGTDESDTTHQNARRATSRTGGGPSLVLLEGLIPGIYDAQGSNKPRRVEVLQWYSKQVRVGVLPRLLDRIERKRTSAPPRCATATPRYVHKVRQRLPAGAMKQLVRDYEAGRSALELMTAYGLGKGTVLRLLQDAEVKVRRQGLSPSDQAEAASLYATGLSAAKVGAKFGCTADSVLSYARAAGVPVRPRHGGRRASP